MGELNVKNKELKSLEQQIKNERDAMRREQKELDAMKVNEKNMENTMNDKNEEYKECESKHNAINEKYKYLVNRIESLESQQLGIGMDHDKKDSGSLAKQLMEAKRLKSEYKSEITTTKNKIKKHS